MAAPLPYQKPNPSTPEFGEKELLLQFSRHLQALETPQQRRKALRAAIEMVASNPNATDWALEDGYVRGHIESGDTRMAALQAAARRCRMPTMRWQQSTGDIITRTDRAVEILRAAIESPKEGLSSRWRDIRSLLVEAGFDPTIFEESGINARGRERDKERHLGTIGNAAKRGKLRGKKGKK